MIVQCEKCGTKFRLDETKIGDRGAKVRCSKCQHSFVVQRPSGNRSPTAKAPLVTPSGGFAIDEVITDLTLRPPEVVGNESSITDPLALPAKLPDSTAGIPDPFRENARVTSPGNLAHPADPALATPSDLPSMPGASEIPGSPPPFSTRDPIHEVETAVYSVPASIRAAAGHGLSSAGPDEIDLGAEGGDRATPATGGAPEPDLIDDDEVTLVSGGDAGSEQKRLPGELFDGATDPGLHDEVTDGEHALGRISPNVVGGSPSTGLGMGPGISDAGTPVGGPRLDDAASVAVTAVVQITDTGDTEPVRGPARGGWSLTVKLVTTMVGLAILGGGVLLWMGGGRLDLSVLGVGKTGDESVAFRGVHPVSMRSVLYPTRSGKQVLVFVGRAENRAGEPREHISALAEIRNRKGEVVASGRGPVGLALDPGFVADLTDAASVAAAYSELAVERGQPKLASQATAPFTVVILEPPEGFATLEHRVRLVAGEPVVVSEPEPEPEADVVEPEEPGERKGKRRRKLKRRRGRRKPGER